MVHSSWLMVHDLWNHDDGRRIDVGSDTLWAVGPANFFCCLDFASIFIYSIIVEIDFHQVGLDNWKRNLILIELDIGRIRF